MSQEQKLTMKDFMGLPRSLNTLALPVMFDEDSYKYSQAPQYPGHMTYAFSYIEPRIGKRGFPKIVFFGIQILLQRMVASKLTSKHVKFMTQLCAKHFGSPDVFSEERWQYIVDVHNGYLPLRIRSVPEGTVMTRGNVQVTVEPTDPECAWLVSPVETFLQRVWKMSTIATLSWNVKQVLLDYLRETSDLPEEVLREIVRYKLHDFGSRGVGGPEDAALSGLAHLVNFKGSDTFIAILMGMECYNTDEMLAESIPAMEHSTVTSWLREGEIDAIANMIDTYGGKVLFMTGVADSFNFYNFVDVIIGEKLKEKILNCGSTFVVRPDSGKPVDMVLYALNSLGKSFGFTTNAKGYKVLHPSIRVIQGDGINFDSLVEILKTMKEAGWAAENLAFGMGGALLQKHDRDELNYAMKCAYIITDGVGRDVKKDPITDPGKKSKAGKLCLVVDKEGNYETIREEELRDRTSVLQLAYEWDGRGKLMSQRPFVIDDNFDNIRERAGF